MARAWEKTIVLEVPNPRTGKMEEIRPTIKEGLQVLSDYATVGSDRLIMKAFLAIIEEIEKINPEEDIRDPKLRAAVEKIKNLKIPDRKPGVLELHEGETWAGGSDN